MAREVDAVRIAICCGCGEWKAVVFDRQCMCSDLVVGVVDRVSVVGPFAELMNSRRAIEFGMKASGGQR